MSSPATQHLTWLIGLLGKQTVPIIGVEPRGAAEAKRITATLFLNVAALY